MDKYICILYQILSKSAEHFLNDDFDKEIVQRFSDYFNSSYNYLVEMYPIYFMQIAFYDKYIEHGYGCVNIFYFNNYFMPYQNHQYHKYNILLVNIYNKVKGFDITDDLSNQMSNFTLNENNL